MNPSQLLRACLAATLLLAASALPVAAQGPAAASTCETCHRDLKDPALSAPAADFGAGDVHRDHGFTCVDCHGGDPSATDKAAAMSAAKGFKGKPAGQQVIAVCGRCHSDAAFMRRYAPKQRVDQVSEYATSVHGQQLAKGDTKVATCVSCHGGHGIRLVGDAKSPVYPTNVATTCSKCHSDATRMAGYMRDGKPLPTNQRASYEKSVHYRAMVDRNDLSAPTCNDCHGNHGAVPPGVGSIANVCGTCHTVFAAKFQTSVHAQIFDRGCVECHSNHEIAQPSDAMLGTTKTAVCSSCHSAGETGYTAAAEMHDGIEGLKSAIAQSEAKASAVENAGIDMADQMLALREASNHLTLARTEMHAFDPKAVATVLTEGTAITTKVSQAADAGQHELSYRKKGLAVSLGFIVLVIIALRLKIRALVH